MILFVRATFDKVLTLDEVLSAEERILGGVLAAMATNPVYALVQLISGDVVNPGVMTPVALAVLVSFGLTGSGVARLLLQRLGGTTWEEASGGAQFLVLAGAVPLTPILVVGAIWAAFAVSPL